MILIYKPLGKTPLEAINYLKKNFALADKKLSYAGRLDPMAEGLLLVLIGDENKRRREFEHFEKEYEFEILLGFDTDSYDLLGIPTRRDDKDIGISQIGAFIDKNSKTIYQKYPPYSSIRIKGKPFYWWTRRGEKVEAPKKKVKIKEFQLIDKYLIDTKTLKKNIYTKINLVKGDFRQEKILNEWERVLEKKEMSTFQILKFKILWSSGGYIRAIADDLGKYLRTGATVYSIKRTGIDKYDLSSALYL